MGRAAADGVARYGGHQQPAALAAREGQGTLRRGRRGSRDRGNPRPREGRGRARRGRLRGTAGRHRRRGGAGRCRSGCPRRIRHEPLLHVAPRRTRARSRRQGLRRGGGHDQGALPPAAPDPERDRASRRPRPARPRVRRVHDVVGDADPTHPAGDAGSDDRHPGGEAARDRAGRGRRLRFQAAGCSRGVALPRARAPAREVGEVDRGALRGLPRYPPRPRHDPGDRARRDRRREDHCRPRPSHGRDGRVPPARHARNPAARRVGVRRLVRHRRLRHRDRRRVHEHDSGDFNASLDRALELLDYDAVRREQAERRERGDSKQLGLGFSTYVEMCGLAPSRILGAIRYAAGGWDAATIRVLPTGAVQVVTGLSPHGQGHETTWSQIAADLLGVAYEEVEVLYGDTSFSPLGMDTYGSRSLAVGGVVLYEAAQKVIAKACKIAFHQFEVAEEDFDYEGGTFTVKGTDRKLTVKEAAFGAWTAHNLPDGFEPGLEATAVYDPPNFSWPGGAHIAVVEVDTETGAADVVRYIAVDDLGTVINPTIVNGQIHGGITQGIAQALFEEAVYDDEGNLVTGSILNYLVPTAAETPSFELDRTSAPSPTHPLGSKGVGETGTIASTPAVINAVIDALAPYGVTDIDMPATPERVWRAMQEGRQ